jgi:hypothetical protein
MKNEERLIEVMAELLAEVHEMRVDMKTQMRDLNTGMTDLNKRVGRLEDQQVKTNMELGELRLSVMRLADFNDRIIRLEDTVFRRAS